MWTSSLRSFGLALLVACAHRAPAPSPVESGLREWQDRMNRRHDNFVAPASVFEWRAVEPQPTPGFSERVAPRGEHADPEKPDERIYLADVPLLDSRHVRGAYFSAPKESHMPEHTLVIEWAGEGRQLAKAVTAARVGKRIAILMRGQILSMPTVLEPVDSPEIHISLSEATPSEGSRTILRALNPPLEPTADQPVRALCAEGQLAACQLLSREHLRGRDLPFDPQAAFLALGAACDHGHGESCRAALAVVGAHALRSSEGHAIPLLRKGCDRKDLESCRALGELLVGDRRDPRPDTLAEGRALLNTACDGKIGKACYTLAESIVRTEGKGDRTTLMSLIERSCLHGYARACEDLGELAIESTPPDRAAALRWFTAGCRLDPDALAYWRPCAPSPSSEEREAILRAAGCRIRSQPACGESPAARSPQPQ